jgi:hypothetical protein
MPLSPQYYEPKPPESRPIGKREVFYKQNFKVQTFIYYKYVLKWPRNRIMKFMFISSNKTYYKLNRYIKQIIKEIYK